MTSRETFETRLIAGLQPIRSFVLATALYHLFSAGLFAALSAGPVALAELAAARGHDPERLLALLRFLVSEGVVDERADGFQLTAQGRGYADFEGWYTMLIGGYGGTFLQLGAALRAGSPGATRDAARVGVGSCAISHYDAIPLTRSLMARVPGGPRRLLDLGCGNALYLVEFCKALPEIEALGVEPDPEGFRAASALVEASGLAPRIRLRCCGALEFFRTDDEFVPDFIVLGFVLHEVLGQSGEDAVVAMLRGITERFPAVHIIVIEVDRRDDDPQMMQHGLALAYYNAYYLFHPFTHQRLERRAFWERLFARAGLQVLAYETVDANVDSTGLEMGFLMRREGQPDAA